MFSSGTEPRSRTPVRPIYVTDLPSSLFITRGFINAFWKTFWHIRLYQNKVFVEKQTISFQEVNYHRHHSSYLNRRVCLSTKCIWNRCRYNHETRKSYTYCLENDQTNFNTNLNVHFINFIKNNSANRCCTPHIAQINTMKGKGQFSAAIWQINLYYIIFSTHPYVVLT